MTRTRTHGTSETIAESGMERIEAIRRLHDRGAYGKVDGVTIDATSASAIICIYDALSEEHRATYRNFPVPKMAVMAFKLLERYGKSA